MNLKGSKIQLALKSKKPVRLEGIAFSEHPDAFKEELPTDEKLIHFELPKSMRTFGIRLVFENAAH